LGIPIAWKEDIPFVRRKGGKEPNADGEDALTDTARPLGTGESEGRVGRGRPLFRMSLEPGQGLGKRKMSWGKSSKQKNVARWGSHQNKLSLKRFTARGRRKRVEGKMSRKRNKWGLAALSLVPEGDERAIQRREKRSRSLQKENGGGSRVKKKTNCILGITSSYGGTMEGSR